MQRAIGAIAGAAALLALGAQAQVPGTGKPLPARAQVTYEGTYALTVTKQKKAKRGWSFNDLSLRNALDTLAHNATTGANSDMRGALLFKTTFAGPAVSAVLTSTGGLESTTYSGLVQGGRCRLTDRENRLVFEGLCDAAGFRGTVATTSNSAVKMAGTFETSATAVEDLTPRPAPVPAPDPTPEVTPETMPPAPATSEPAPDPAASPGPSPAPTTAP